MQNKTDLELVAEMKKGSEQAFNIIVNRYKDKVQGLINRIIRTSHEDREETLQDVLVIVFKKVHMFKGESQFSSWLYRVTVNEAFQKLRRLKTKSGMMHCRNMVTLDNVPEVQASYTDSPDWGLERREHKSAINQAISELPTIYQATYAMFESGEYGAKEIAAILNITIPAVKSRLHRARIEIRSRA